MFVKNKLLMDSVLNHEFHMRLDICFLHSWRKVNRITTTSSFNLNGMTLRILGKEWDPKNTTFNTSRVLSLDYDIKITKHFDTSTETIKQNITYCHKHKILDKRMHKDRIPYLLKITLIITYNFLWRLSLLHYFLQLSLN